MSVFWFVVLMVVGGLFLVLSIILFTSKSKELVETGVLCFIVSVVPLTLGLVAFLNPPTMLESIPWDMILNHFIDTGKIL